ncbi:hypothetical protein APSETT444_000131 [Aspergillus pseudonomiae]
MSKVETYLEEKRQLGGTLSGTDSLEDDLDRDEVYPLKEQRRILHKIDRRLVTGLGLLMCVSLVDRTNLGNAMIAGSATVVSYAITFFLPLILRSELKFPQAASQVLTTPPYFFAGIFMYAQGWLGDKYHIRAPLIVYNCIQCIVGLAILGWVQIPGVQYFGIFLVTSASNATIPAALTYQANNIRGQWKRAFCSASIVSFGGTGGVAGSLVFRSQDSPRYLPGIYACIA